MRPLLVVTVMLVNVLAAGCGGMTGRMTSVAQIAGFVGSYMAAHKNIRRVVETNTRTVTLVTQGDRMDLTADLGHGFTGRYIETEKAAYVQSPLGQEVAPGKTWDQITDYWDAGNKLGPGLLRGIGMDVADSYRIHQLFAQTGRLIATDSDGDRTHYVISIDMRKAIDRLDLATFLAYQPWAFYLLNEEPEEIDEVESGDPQAQERLRNKLSKDYGPSATYELWVDTRNRPVQYVLNARLRTRMRFSEWDTATVAAPPGAQTRSLP